MVEKMKNCMRGNVRGRFLRMLLIIGTVFMISSFCLPLCQIASAPLQGGCYQSQMFFESFFGFGLWDNYNESFFSVMCDLASKHVLGSISLLLGGAIILLMVFVCIRPQKRILFPVLCCYSVLELGCVVFAIFASLSYISQSLFCVGAFNGIVACVIFWSILVKSNRGDDTEGKYLSILAVAIIVLEILLSLWSWFYDYREMHRLGLTSEYLQEINATMYDGLDVSGAKIVELIKKLAQTGEAYTITVTTLESSTITYSSTAQYSDPGPTMPAHINETGIFRGGVTKGESGEVTDIAFVQQ